MGNDYLNDNFSLPSANNSEIYSFEKLNSILQDEEYLKIQMDLIHFFRKNRYISNIQFKYITWNTFCVKQLGEDKERPAEEVELAKKNLELLEKFLNDKLPFIVKLSVVYYKPDSCVYIFDKNRYSSDDFQDYLDKNI